MTGFSDDTDTVRVVLADANILYSQVLRDYLLYAADQKIITITWSRQILAEVTEPSSATSRASTEPQP
ncbi:hypothetical protein [Actinoplanes sp. G11-F43]|uniref:hypothetical protein n=1 Tax=Actinoplanes sp. G11-F43 TaxID=3424130 RepID=UPI003D33E76B